MDKKQILEQLIKGLKEVKETLEKELTQPVVAAPEESVANKLKALKKAQELKKEGPKEEDTVKDSHQDVADRIVNSTKPRKTEDATLKAKMANLKAKKNWPKHLQPAKPLKKEDLMCAEEAPKKSKKENSDDEYSDEPAPKYNYPQDRFKEWMSKMKKDKK